jgi:succinate-acetate transporter protein
MVHDEDQGCRATGDRAGMTETSAPRAAPDELAPRAVVTLRPIAGPLALGFFGLAAATFVASGLQLDWVDPTQGRQAALCILAFTVPLQFTASLFGFLARDGVAATGMGLLAGTWAAIGLVAYTGHPGSTSDALGLFLLVAGVAIWAAASSALASKLVPALVLATAGLRFLVTGIYQLTSSEAWKDAAGVIGLLLAAFAIYAAYAAEFEDVVKRPVLPLGRRGKGERAVKGSYAEQIANVPHEPGVRQQL